MKRFKDVMEVWDNGAVSPLNPSTEDVVAWLTDFFSRTGARKRVATQWIYQGKKYESMNCPVPIPDYSGLVYSDENFRHWVVLNPDGTEKFTIGVPKISPKSLPENGYLGFPGYMKDKPPHIM